MAKELTPEEIAALQAENKTLKDTNKTLDTANKKLEGDLKNATDAKSALEQKLKVLQKEIESADQLNDELQAKINGAGPAAAKLTFQLKDKHYRAVHAVVVPGKGEFSAAEIAANQDLQKALIAQQSSAIEEVIKPE